MSILSAEEIDILVKSAKDFVGQESPIGRVRTLRDTRDPLGWSKTLYAQMCGLGWSALTVPEACGGLGLGFDIQCLILETLGGHLVPEPLLSGAVGIQVLKEASHEQARALLPLIATGESTICFADRGAIEVTGNRLTGRVDDVPDLVGASTCLVTADTGQDRGIYLVDLGSPGIKTERRWRIDGRNAGTLHLDQAIAVRLGGTELVALARDCAAIALSAEMLGGAEQAFRMTVSYLQTREQFGVKIGSFQALQHRAARMFMEIGLLRSTVYGAAASVDSAVLNRSRLASLAKATAGETYVYVANQAIQLHGGIGVTDEYDIGLFLKRARVSEVTWGTASEHRQRWANIGGY
jgi:alkylation response protein AidB-like acyl-CoA dehydrogenase